MSIEIYVKNLTEGRLEANPDSHDRNCSRTTVDCLNAQGSTAHKCTELCMVYKEIMANLQDPDRVYNILDSYERRHAAKN